MLILANLNGPGGQKYVKDVRYWGSVDKAKKDLYYVEFDGNFYEWVMIDKGNSTYDYEAHFCWISHGLPYGCNAYKLTPSSDKKCECGSTKLNAPGHSDWCPKFSEYGNGSFR